MLTSSRCELTFLEVNIDKRRRRRLVKSTASQETVMDVAKQTWLRVSASEILWTWPLTTWRYFCLECICLSERHFGSRPWKCSQPTLVSASSSEHCTIYTLHVLQFKFAYVVQTNTRDSSMKEKTGCKLLSENKVT